MSIEKIPETAISPFGGVANRIQMLSVSSILEMYKRKCGTDINISFGGIDNIGLYQCEKTGYKFWLPAQISGDEAFYKKLSSAWPNYYRISRWEHSYAKKHILPGKSVLEIGCGPGHFLKSLEGIVRDALGIELNRDAISSKVTRFPIRPVNIEDLSANGLHYEVIYAFQVLEHISDPHSFISAALKCLAPNGLLVFSTPNNDHQPFMEQEDAFDLPPHHMGHFNPSIYQRIGDLFRLEVLEIHIQPREFLFQTPTSSTRDTFIYKLARSISRNLMNIAYAISREPGENLLVVYRKP